QQLQADDDRRHARPSAGDQELPSANDRSDTPRKFEKHERPEAAQAARENREADDVDESPSAARDEENGKPPSSDRPACGLFRFDVRNPDAHPLLGGLKNDWRVGEDAAPREWMRGGRRHGPLNHPAGGRRENSLPTAGTRHFLPRHAVGKADKRTTSG